MTDPRFSNRPYAGSGVLGGGFDVFDVNMDSTDFSPVWMLVFVNADGEPYSIGTAPELFPHSPLSEGTTLEVCAIALEAANVMPHRATAWILDPANQKQISAAAGELLKKRSSFIEGQIDADRDARKAGRYPNMLQRSLWLEEHSEITFLLEL